MTIEMKKMTLSVPESIHKLAKSISGAKGICMRDYIISLISEDVKKRSKKTNKQLAQEFDNAVNHKNSISEDELFKALAPIYDRIAEGIEKGKVKTYPIADVLNSIKD